MVKFFKYSIYGNNFVIVDETEGQMVHEKDIHAFSNTVICPYFGIGADKLIILQKYSKSFFEQKLHWEIQPGGEGKEEPDYLIRVYGKEGREEFNCGNAIVCAGTYLHQHYGIENSNILIDISSTSPRLCQSSTTDQQDTYQVRFPFPTSMPESLYYPEGMENQESHPIMSLPEIPLLCQLVNNEGQQKSLLGRLPGFFVYPGEPHLVFFENQSHLPGEGKEIFDNILQRKPGTGRNPDKHGLWDQWLIHYLDFGMLFPEIPQKNLKVSFARILADDSIEYRTFEVGINRERLACGTAAIAVAAATLERNDVNSNHICLFPLRSHWYEEYRDAQIKIRRESNEQFLLECNPRFIFSGKVTTL